MSLILSVLLAREVELELLARISISRGRCTGDENCWISVDVRVPALKSMLKRPISV